MGNKTDNFKKILEGRGKKRSVRMAYTLNNEQPVQCTLVSDQPFFYLDDEIGLEDDYLLDDALFGFDDIEMDPALETHLLEMKKKIDLYDLTTRETPQRRKDREADFIHSFENTDQEICLDEVLTIIRDSRMGEALIKFAYDQEIYFQNSHQCDDAYFDKKAKTLFVNSTVPAREAVLAVLRELRSAWQEGQKADITPLSLHPDYAILMNRVQKADVTVSVIRCAWELKLAGYEDIWAIIDQSAMADMGRALAREALSDFRTLNNGKAQAAAFETWFLSDRCKDVDKTLINAMLSGYDNYAFDDQDLKVAPIVQLITRVGEMPFGKNYLAAHANMIMEDGLFTEVRDRANANFLWFIKFERAFAETEQHLQSSDDLSTSGGDPVIYNQFEDTNNAQPSNHDKSGEKPERGGDNIIHAAFGHPQAQITQS